MYDLIKAIFEHLFISVSGVSTATVFGIAIGVIVSKKDIISKPILTIIDMIQTIPSLALFSLLMIIFGLGNTTVIIGIFLYSLLPIVRNTYTGIKSISPLITEVACGMGMSQIQSLIRVEIPIAMPMILAGISIAFIASLGIVVIGVLIGSGGLGYIIYSGIQSQDWGIIIKGTIPVVILSLLTQFVSNLINKLQKRKNNNA